MVCLRLSSFKLPRTPLACPRLPTREWQHGKLTRLRTLDLTSPYCAPEVSARGGWSSHVPPLTSAFPIRPICTPTWRIEVGTATSKPTPMQLGTSTVRRTHFHQNNIIACGLAHRPVSRFLCFITPCPSLAWNSTAHSSELSMLRSIRATYPRILAMPSRTAGISEYAS